MNKNEINHSSTNFSFLGMVNPHGGPFVKDESFPLLASRSEGGDNGTKKSNILMGLVPKKRYPKSNARISIPYKADEYQSSSVDSRDVKMKEVSICDTQHDRELPSCFDSFVTSIVSDHHQIRGSNKDLISSDDIIVSEGIRVPHGLVQKWKQGFDIGDMVWGKVKSHPWWPGQIYNDAFASHEVRRSKRKGQLLVAFFGDNNYGWFRPTEIIPFDPHFVEKLKQTSVRNFVNAVEEAIDETSRREALGLTCFCHNEFNFRPSRVPHYFHVDVPSYEPGGVYSLKQISAARNGFKPKSLLSFVKDKALNPTTNESPILDHIKNMATLLAYRRAIFEEFDETYPQAFGVEPVRPSPNSNSMLDQPKRFTPLGTLSGKLVISESQQREDVSKLAAAIAAKAPLSGKGKGKGKGKYVRKRKYKRRGRANPTGIDIGGSSSPPGMMNLLLYTPYYRSFCAILNNRSGQLRIAAGEASPPANVVPASSEANHCMLGADGVAGGLSYLDILNGLTEAAFNAKGGVTIRAARQASAKPTAEPPKAAAAAAGTVKKATAQKHRLVAGTVDTGELKRKRKKKAPGIESGATARKKGASTSAGTGGKLSAGKSILVASEPQRSAGGAVKPDGAEVDVTWRNVDLRLVVSDIQELAANHSYGSERDAAGNALRLLRGYRCDVYKKGRVVPPPPTEPGAPESRREPGAARMLQESVASRAPIAALSKASAADQRGYPTQTKKTILRPDEPVKAGQKRGLSERQVESSAKRLKNLKSLPVEKKPAVRVKAAAIAAEGLQRNQKGKELSLAAASPVKGKLAIAKATEGASQHQEQPVTPPPKTPSPTLLIMKFPAASTLPSVTSLKARFVRFGPLDQSAIRVFWKSYTCKVVFKFKPDAERAFNYAKSHDVFGQVKVTYYLKELDGEGSHPQLSESQPATDGLQVMSPGDGPVGATVSSVPSSPLVSRPPNGPLKSILKKSGEGGGQRSNSGPVGGTSRSVRFMSVGADEAKAAGKTDGRANGDGAPSSPQSLGPPRNSRDPRLLRRVPPTPVKTDFSVPPPINPAPVPNNQPVAPPPLGAPPSFPFLARPLPPAPLPQLPVPVLQLTSPPPPRTLGELPVPVPLPPPPPRPLGQPPVPVPQLIAPPPPRTLGRPPVPGAQFIPSPPPRTPDVPVPRSRSRDPRRRLQQIQAAESSRKELPDISAELVNLLFKCKDVVNIARDARGYASYRPL